MGDENPCRGGGDGFLPILGQSAAVEPDESALDHPSPWQNLEALGGIGALDNFQRPLADVLQSALKFRAAVGGVCNDVTQPGEAMADRFENLGYAVAVLDESLGYGVTEGLFTVAEVGAPRRRQRLFVLAHSSGLHGQAVERRHPARADAGVADADGRQPPGRADPGEAAGREPYRQPRRSGDELANADGTGSQGWSVDACQHAGEQPTWPPSPEDRDGWRRSLRCAPDLEPAVRRGVDGLAHRVDRLRLCGNGVVPLVAAHAWRTLKARFDDAA